MTENMVKPKSMIIRPHLNKEQSGLHHSTAPFFPVANILSFSLISLCERFQNEQIIPDGREQSRLIYVEHYVILKEGWKCLSVYS